MKAHRTILPALTFALGLGPVAADAPLPPPQRVTACSAKGPYCAISDPVTRVTTVYRSPEGGPEERRWSMPGWFRNLALADDGDHLVVGFDGTLLPLDYQPTLPLLRFFRRGRLVRAVTVEELVPDRSKLGRTASHYSWGRCLGFDPSGRYGVETVGRGVLHFDVKTGRPVP